MPRIVVVNLGPFVWLAATLTDADELRWARFGLSSEHARRRCLRALR